MQPHEKYELLSAMSATGQLDSEEEKDLVLHIQTCEACRVVRKEFQEVVQEVASDASVLEAPAKIEGESEDAALFVNFARSRGIEFSGDAQRALSPSKTRGSRWLKLEYVAAIGLVAVGVCVGFALKASADRKLARVQQQTTRRAAQTASPQVSLSETEKDGAQLAVLKAELQDLRNRSGEVPQLNERVTQTEQERDALKIGISERDSTIQGLQASLTDTQKTLAAANSTITSLTVKNDQSTAGLAAERERSMELAGELRDTKDAAEQDRELSAATSEVRELMGARRLFMVDVYDGADRIRANRSFGRVFYSEGKSLIFYAFDLNKIRDPKRVTFEAWAEDDKDQDPKHARHLGDFYIDDAAQQRWVMKVNDPEKLKAIDAIYVTVESGRGASRPSGQKLLYAYLGGQPNHP